MQLDTWQAGSDGKLPDELPENFTDGEIASILAVACALTARTRMNANQIAQMVGVYMDARQNISEESIQLLRQGIQQDSFILAICYTTQALREGTPEPLRLIEPDDSASTKPNLEVI